MNACNICQTRQRNMCTPPALRASPVAVILIGIVPLKDQMNVRIIYSKKIQLLCLRMSVSRIRHTLVHVYFSETQITADNAFPLFILCVMHNIHMYRPLELTCR